MGKSSGGESKALCFMYPVAQQLSYACCRPARDGAHNTKREEMNKKQVYIFLLFSPAALGWVGRPKNLPKGKGGGFSGTPVALLLHSLFFFFMWAE
jgi:hypothetical protein